MEQQSLLNVRKMMRTFFVISLLAVCVFISYLYLEDVLGMQGRVQPVQPVLQADQSTSGTRLSELSLKRLQVALEQNQVKLQSRLNDLDLDDHSLLKAVQPGNPERLKTVLAKALRGEDINLMIIGGSHSAGGKLGLDHKTLNGLYFKVFTKWWNSILGNTTKSIVKEIPLTVGDTSCYFFAFCYKMFIAQGDKIDIALIEMSANENELKPFEQLTRQVLEYFSAPAVLYVNLVSGLGNNLNPRCKNLETVGQTEVARHYGITSFSVKEILCRREGDRWKIAFTNITGSDGNHLDAKAHAQVAMMMIWYVRGVLGKVLSDVSNASLETVNHHANEIKTTYLPKPLFIRRRTEILRNPLCQAWKTPDIFQNLHHASLQLKVVSHDGFTPCFIVRGQRVNVRRMSKELRSDTQAGWCATQASSKLKLIIFVPPLADYFMYRSRSVTVLSRNQGGEAEIWLDKNTDKAIKVDAKRVHDRVNTIATRVTPGYHSITVMTTRGELFMVAGVFVGPPDFFAS